MKTNKKAAAEHEAPLLFFFLLKLSRKSRSVPFRP
jgi:hypothetical protein